MPAGYVFPGTTAERTPKHPSMVKLMAKPLSHRASRPDGIIGRSFRGCKHTTMAAMMNEVFRSRGVRNALNVFLAVLAFLPVGAHAAGRTTHQFLEVAISPDGRHVASVEGDASPWGGEPVIRSLVIRTSDGASTSTVSLPCGGVRECWPSSPTWNKDGSALVFALRTPGSHARSIYSVDVDARHLTKLLAFDGTIEDLRFGPDGSLAMLATA